MNTTVFAPGELALLLDHEGKRYLIQLAEAETFHSHLGAIRHQDVIGQPEGSFIGSTRGRVFAVVRPRLADYMLDMPRRTGIVYPKDAGHLLLWADIGPGMRVLESGVGSGALTLVLLRAVGERGEVVGYDQRADFLELALSNVRAVGTGSRLLLRERDIYEGVVDAALDRVVLDLPEPWRVLPHLPGVLRAAGLLAAYTPSIVQAVQLVEALRASRQYVQIETHETLIRGWHIQAQAVRPEHEMVGHTGFVTVARLMREPLEPGIRSRTP